MQIFTVMKRISLDSLEIFAAVEILAIIFLRLLQLSKNKIILFILKKKEIQKSNWNALNTIKRVQFYYLERENYKN